MSTLAEANEAFCMAMVAACRPAEAGMARANESACFIWVSWRIIKAGGGEWPDSTSMSSGTYRNNKLNIEISSRREISGWQKLKKPVLNIIKAIKRL